MVKGSLGAKTKKAAGPTSIRLPAELSEFLRSKAGQKHVSVASIILQLVQNWKDDEERQTWQNNVGLFCDNCRGHLVSLLYRKDPSGQWQRRYNTPPLHDIEKAED